MDPQILYLFWYSFILVCVVTDTIDLDEFYDFVDNFDNTECKGIPKEILEASK